MGYISAQQAATKWGISKRRVQVLCTENRIKNATRIGNMWVVPEDALKPADGRVQTHHTVESPTARAAIQMILKLSVNNQSVESSGITKDYKDALCEYVWNSFEANATAVAIDCIPNELTGSAEIVITDNGDGIA